ncbi:MAG: hypothetical protein COB14_04645 [Alphaproteobacteria bacterium]|nr:MAG: hypothetical protein COB14_04645 [Alphaproteobacteria bacterium]
MAAPLSGIGQHAAPPISQPFQPGGNDQTREIRQANQEARENELQATDAPLAQSQNSAPQKNAQSERGSIVDLVI